MDSPLAAALEQVGDRWSLLIVEALLEGPSRFNDLQTSVTGIAPNVLSQRLKHLERERLILARPYSDRPLRLSYELTPEGRELASALHSLAAWGARRGSTQDQRAHAVCGTPLEPRLWCPTCDTMVALDEPVEITEV